MWTKAVSWLIAFGLLLAIVVAIVNAFIHSRNAYAVVPMGVTLSTIVVALLLIANVQLALQERNAQGARPETSPVISALGLGHLAERL